MMFPRMVICLPTIFPLPSTPAPITSPPTRLISIGPSPMIQPSDCTALIISLTPVPISLPNGASGVNDAMVSAVLGRIFKSPFAIFATRDVMLDFCVNRTASPGFTASTSLARASTSCCTGAIFSCGTLCAFSCSFTASENDFRLAAYSLGSLASCWALRVIPPDIVMFLPTMFPVPETPTPTTSPPTPLILILSFIRASILCLRANCVRRISSLSPNSAIVYGRESGPTRNFQEPLPFDRGRNGGDAQAHGFFSQHQGAARLFLRRFRSRWEYG